MVNRAFDEKDSNITPDESRNQGPNFSSSGKATLESWRVVTPMEELKNKVEMRTVFFADKGGRGGTYGGAGWVPWRPSVPSGRKARASASVGLSTAPHSIFA